ncbi:FAD/NAD(P)-binding domain-containing protein [Annulohypoxylon maeteangense]|uniref:FAD/NAD(P)-binding domain-containing protein n=1 Tax=Annulohypoxylon maeteangense TaxID=1927788 RepID=UPI002007F0FC|nr:FAD/NAD(P)-binding domain-containing protein [Annulohypoxylon maeteangense]KAI0883213.1 FAD/NAD(P)-binding domain-containing protein [Annulohypoxylon maeteangense]
MPSAVPSATTTGAEHIEPAGNEGPFVNGFNRKPNGVSTWPTNGHARASSVSSADTSNPTVFEPHTFDWNQHRGPGLTHGYHEEEAGGPRSRAYARIRSWGDDPKTAKFPRISKPMELMRTNYDCVVIGSGYGGGVAASRMARAGESVCLLERGKERWPGEYPDSTGDSIDQLHYSGELAPGWLPKKIVEGGDPTGMYHMIFGNCQNAVVCNGLGGTSLMNANVYLEADKDTLQLEAWPKEIRDNPDCLDEYYEKAEKVLQPEPYPDDWPKLPKLELLEKQAKYLSMEEKFRRVRQTTRFVNGPNSCGVEMFPSAMTGQDCTGLNDGSKNTTLVTYLADAWNWGADMFCEAEVRYITKAPYPQEGYIVYFAWHGRNRGHFRANLHGDLMWVHAKRAVFLGAGAIGSTEILLRSKNMGLDLSDKVGENMSGNGDILGFGYNTDHEVNAMGRPFPSPYHPVGPTITGIIDNRSGHDNPLDGYVIEEGAIPGALAPFLQAMLELLPGSIEPTGEGLIGKFQANLARLGTAFLGPYFRKGAIERTQVYLIMSHDSNQAYLTLKDDKPVLEFVGVGRSDHVKYLNRVLEKATKAVGGTFVQNPFYALLGKQQVTVHPIGGACMARDGTGSTGATNHMGELFTGSGDKTHSGLIVTDAAVIPTALGANPFATITALAERSVDHYAKSQRLTIDMTPNDVLDLFGSPQHKHIHNRKRGSVVHVDEVEEIAKIDSARNTIINARRMNDSGFGFTEVMSGYIHRDEGLKRDNVDTYKLAARRAESLSETARFFLSVQSFNIRSIINDPNHRAMLTGTFVCPTLEGSPFMVQRGDFNLFLLDRKAPGTRNLTYDFDMRGINGRSLHFHGYKVVDSSVALSPVQFWKSTSTLYVTITETLPNADRSCADADECGLLGKIVAKGIMRIQPQDFLSEVMTLTPTGSSIFRKVVSAGNFLTFFTRKSMSLLLAPLTPLQYPVQTCLGFVNNTPPTRTFKIKASDGVVTSLHMWEPTNTSIDTRDLFMIPGASVDHQIYALPTIRYNAVNYFRRAGYRVWITVHRIGMLMVAQDDWTTFDARLDFKACLEKIREESILRDENRAEPEKIYTIAHCMGSVALSTGLLDGTIPAKWIQGITCSQVFMNPIWNLANMIKITALPIPGDIFYKFLLGDWFSFSTSKNDSLLQKGLNQLLRLMPDSRKELCNNASCHRTTMALGRCWNHHNLNEATHRQIDRFFGGVSMTLMHILMKQGYQGGVTGNKPLFERLDTHDNIRRLKGVPIMLFVGRDNAVLSLESTEKTYEILTDTFGTGDDRSGVRYRRRVVPGYGHLDCWMGRNAWKDVYPFVREEVDRVVRGDGYRFDEPNDQFKELVESGKLLY